MQEFCDDTAHCMAQFLLEDFGQHRADGSHLRYQDAVQLIQKKFSKKKTRERLEYLLRKASDSQSLDAALQKTIKQFGMKRGAADRILDKLKKADINPITLPNSSHIQSMKSLQKCF